MGLKKHSDLSPSSAKRWMNCPGSVALEAKSPPQETKYAAAEGTVAHILAEKYASGAITRQKLEGNLGRTVEQEGHIVTVGPDMIEGAIGYAQHIEADRKVLKGEKVEAFEAGVCASSVDKSLWGTADYYLFQPLRKLIIRDFKFGKNVKVKAEENEQMAIYAIGVMDTEAGWKFDEVELVIDQPRAGDEKRWKTDVKWLKAFRDLLRKAVAETKVENAKTVIGDWCWWCRAQSICPAKQSQSQDKAREVFGVVTEWEKLDV